MKRSCYGELIASNSNQLDQDKIEIAVQMAFMAAAKKKILAGFNNMKWKKINSKIGDKLIGEARHHEIYDISLDGTKTLVCVRAVEGTRYGQKTTSHDYYLIRRHGRGLRVVPANKAIAAKAAKAAGSNLGLAIAACEAHPPHAN